jgi:predicted MFS family arabinose efflux permease
VYGLSAAGNGAGLTSPRVLGAGLGGAALVAAFGWHALHTGRPLVDIRLFRSRAFSSATGALFLYVGAVFGMAVLLPLYYQLVRGQTPLHAGLLIAPWGLGAIVTMPISGRVTDRYGARGIALAGAAVALLGALAYPWTDIDTPIALLAGAGFVVGLGHGLIVPALIATTYQGLPRSAVPSATAASNIAIRVGSSFGAALLAVLLQIYIRASIPGASGSLADAAAVRTPTGLHLLARTFGHSFWWTAAIIAVSALPIALVPRRRKVHTPQSPQDTPG